MVNTTRELIYGKRPIQRNNPQEGESEWYYLDPRGTDSLSDMRQINVPNKETPNPFANEIQNYLYQNDKDNYKELYGETPPPPPQNNYHKEMLSQMRKRAAENEFLSNSMDVLYGMNRTINGMTFGGLDWAGDKLGRDPKMTDYLQIKDQQGAGDAARWSGRAAELGGAYLSSKKLYPLLPMAYNGYKIGKGYDQLRQDPYIGHGSDVIARMKNHNGEPVVLQRGEAIPGPNGEVIVSGRSLQHETGTSRNYGLDKIIHKHDMPRNEVTRIPRLIRNNQPTEITNRNQHIYLIQRPNGEIKISTTPQGDHRTISSMYWYTPDK